VSAAQPAVAGVPLVARVYARLADGQFHSGEQLARELKLTRSAIWKAMASLRQLGATVEAVRNRGYRLSHAGEALDGDTIRALLPRGTLERLGPIETVWSVASTNTELLGRPFPRTGTGQVLLAEYQTAGKGRRGRAWLAPPGGAICMSVSWTFPAVSQDLGALGLVIGVCALRALEALDLVGTQLKWPNDLLHGGKKVGGILIELRAEASGPACVVIGLGMNVALGDALLTQIEATGMAATDLRRCGLVVARNAVVAALLTSIVQGLAQFEREGLKPFLAEWRAADALRGRGVNVVAAAELTRGVARGIDAHGALLVETTQGVQRFVSGDVSVRPE
jgi:BirA family transcriptional regulator, biotin operon repressor / biotin---[acetyl-CoA-carboxylase] ligase